MMTVPIIDTPYISPKWSFPERRRRKPSKRATAIGPERSGLANVSSPGFPKKITSFSFYFTLSGSIPRSV